MQTVTPLFEQICASNNWRTEVKAVIDGTDYFMSDLISMNRSVQCMESTDKPIGAVMSGTAVLQFIPKSVVPTAAEITIKIRATDGTNVSEWINHGTYFVNERSRSEFGRGDAIEVTCFDAMCKTDASYASHTNFSTWPQTDTAVATEIASIIGVTLDSRTVLKGYSVLPPGEYTMREVLSHVGVANCGNWIITPDNKLLLVPYGGQDFPADVLGTEQPAAIRFFGGVYLAVDGGYDGDESDIPEYDVARKVDHFEDLGDTTAVSGITLYYADESAYSAGDETGMMIEAECPWATQTIADDMLSTLGGYAHRGFNADGAFIPPYVELGDLALVSGVRFVITELAVDYGTLYRPSLSTPGPEDIETEYPYLSPIERQIKRTVKVGQDYYGTSITHGEGLTVTRMDTNDQAYNAVNLNADSMTAVDENGNAILEMDFANQTFKWNGDINIQNGSIRLEQLGSDVTSYITSEIDGLRTTVSETYATQSEVNSLNTTLSSQISQTSDNIALRFTRLEQTIQEGDDANNDAISELNSHILIGANSMRFLVDNSDYEMELANTGMQIKGAGDSAVAEFTATGVLLPQETTVPLGGTLALGNFQFVPRANGNLSMVHIN